MVRQQADAQPLGPVIRVTIQRAEKLYAEIYDLQDANRSTRCPSSAS